VDFVPPGVTDINNKHPKLGRCLAGRPNTGRRATRTGSTRGAKRCVIGKDLLSVSQTA
jgi:hypothetical protein